MNSFIISLFVCDNMRVNVIAHWLYALRIDGPSAHVYLPAARSDDMI
jgi:hypothetical protein